MNGCKICGNEKEKSYAKNPLQSIFRKDDISAFKRRAEELNKEGRGDQIAVYLKKVVRS
ncbi:MAG: hypothetical protein WEB33_10625 [Bacteroidota bacterium]